MRAARPPPASSLGRYESLARALATAETFAEVGALTAREVCLALGAKAAIVMTTGNDPTRLELVGDHGVPMDRIEGLRELDIRAGFPICRAFVSGDEEWFADHEAYRRSYGARVDALMPTTFTGTLASLPLTSEGRTLAALALSFEPGVAPSEEEKTFARSLLDLSARSFVRAERREAERAAHAAALEAAEQTARDHVERLQAVTSALGEAIAPEDVADVILDNVVGELGGEVAVFYEPSDDGRELVAKRFRNATDELGRTVARFPIDGTGASASAFRAREPLFLQSAREYEERFPTSTVLGTPWMAMGAFAVLPLVVGRGRVAAVLAVSFSRPRPFSPMDRAFATNLAEQSAQALERARLYAAERAAKREAETASHLKDEFLATVSHELRTPLTAILGWSSLLRSDRLDPDAVERAIATIERNARAQARLVDDVLDVSRIISGKLAIRSEPVDVASTLQQALDAVRPGALAKEITLECDLPTSLKRVVGDPDRLQQVYWNLLSNAVKFTPRRGRIRIGASEAGQWVRVSVADSGAGIRPSFLPHIFEPFRQADGSSTRAHAGLGLGLSIARHLVQLHGGEIEARSEGDGRGAMFVVSLPTTSAASAARRPPGHEQPASRLRELDLLVVDDDDDARELAVIVLSAEGATVRSASSARQAIERLAEKTPDVVVCDVGMPEEDGLSLLPRARAAAARRGERFRALAFTAYADTEHADLVTRAGFDAHLAKPVDAQTLVSAVLRLARPSDG